MTGNPITIETLTEEDFNTPKSDFLFRWWSQKTHSKPDHMLPVTPAFLRNNLIFATAAYSGEKVVGAAGLIAPLGKHNQKLYSLDGRLVVEFRSNFVHPLYEKKGIGTEFIKLRYVFAKQHNYLSVTVTKEDRIVKIMTGKFGWQPIENFNGQYEHILMELRNCGCMSSEEDLFKGKRCSVCPYHQKIILVDG